MLFTVSEVPTHGHGRHLGAGGVCGPQELRFFFQRFTFNIIFARIIDAKLSYTYIILCNSAEN